MGLATERRLADDVSPAARIRETFALFVPGDANVCAIWLASRKSEAAGVNAQILGVVPDKRTK